MAKIKRIKRKIRHNRVRAKITGTVARPRLSVYRSSKHVFLQVIDDVSGKTVIGLSDKAVKKDKLTKSDRAFEVGKLIAGVSKEKGIKKVVFDRGGYKYHGRIKKAADGAREGGLEF
ncbi:50S ribosomal protein L18 [Candidatus Giovannonibacteria bacterium]|nr:50S ribosomal protein L18 [Candidatus Giovannonibacteria bacterium]